MRAVFSLALLLAAGPALAGSIDLVQTQAPGAGAGSVTRIKCDGCPPPAPKKYAYKVPVLAKGKETVELKTVNGQQKFFRTDAFLGGSPVVFVSTATPEAIAALGPKQGNPDGIDKSAKTAAVPPQLDHKAPIAADLAAAPAAPKPLDTAGFSLRAN